MVNEHEQCGRCGRKLKTAKSRQDGFGPVCKRKWETEKTKDQQEMDLKQEDPQQ